MQTTQPLGTFAPSALAESSAPSLAPLPPTVAPTQPGVPRPLPARRMKDVAWGTWRAGGLPTPVPVPSGGDSGGLLPDARRAASDPYSAFRYAEPNRLDWSLLADLFESSKE